jgi:hypothetical protein
MFDLATLSDEKQTEELANGPHICLRADHPGFFGAALLMGTLGGQRCCTAVGVVFRFRTSPSRDDALDVLRSKMGWTVADPYEGPSLLAG